MIKQNGAEIARLRKKIGVTQTELAELFGVTLSTWQKKESETSKETIGVKPGEFQYLQLLAGEHPVYKLVQKKPGKAPITVKTKPHPQEIRRIREKCGYSVDDAAKEFGCARHSWITKENPNLRGSLTVGEWNYFLLLADEHPGWTLENINVGAGANIDPLFISFPTLSIIKL